MPGAFNQRLPQPKYAFIWDVEVVLEYLRNLPENNLLSDKTLPFKVVLLLVLTSTSRALEIKNLNLNYLSKSQSVYNFYPCKLAKTCVKRKAPPKPLKFWSFPGEKKLCVCATLNTSLSNCES